MDCVRCIKDDNYPLDRDGLIARFTAQPPAVTQRGTQARAKYLDTLRRWVLSETLPKRGAKGQAPEDNPLVYRPPPQDIEELLRAKGEIP
jgi:hypothetical protein